MTDIDTSNWTPGTRYFTQITDQDHSGWLYIITIMSLAYMLIVLGVRFVVKYGMYGYDDWALLASVVLGVGQHVALLAGVGEGLGKSMVLLSREQLRLIEKYTAAHIFLFFLAHCASKFSTAIFMQRLFSSNGRKSNIYLCWGLVGASGLYAVWAVLSFVSGCPDPAFPLSLPDRCTNRGLRWTLITTVDIATEIALCVVPIFLVLDVRLKRDAKILVSAVFSARLLNILFVAFNLDTVHAAEHARDFGLGVVPPIIWTQSELLWSVIAASVPCLKTFMRPFDSIDEETWRSNNDMYASQRSQRSHRSWLDQKIPLKELKGKGRETVISSSGKSLGTEPRVRPDRVGHDVVITHSGPGNASDEDRRRSWGSQERIIRAHTQWEVTHETRSSES